MHGRATQGWRDNRTTRHQPSPGTPSPSASEAWDPPVRLRLNRPSLWFLVLSSRRSVNLAEDLVCAPGQQPVGQLDAKRLRVTTDSLDPVTDDGFPIHGCNQSLKR